MTVGPIVLDRLLRNKRTMESTAVTISSHSSSSTTTTLIHSFSPHVSAYYYWHHNFDSSDSDLYVTPRCSFTSLLSELVHQLLRHLQLFCVSQGNAFKVILTRQVRRYSSFHAPNAKFYPRFLDSRCCSIGFWGCYRSSSIAWTIHIRHKPTTASQSSNIGIGIPVSIFGLQWLANEPTFKPRAEPWDSDLRRIPVCWSIRILCSSLLTLHKHFDTPHRPFARPRLEHLDRYNFRIFKQAARHLGLHSRHKPTSRQQFQYPLTPRHSVQCMFSTLC